MEGFSFACQTCGKLHEGSPSVGFGRPYYWRAEYDDDPRSRLSNDLCVIEERDYFIRCILEVPIHGVEEGFLWGVWITQSEANFKRYLETFDDTPERETFGYFANRLPDYPDTLSLHTTVHWKSGGRQRPWVEIRESDHPLYRDWSEGISWERAATLAAPLLHAGENR